MSRCRLGNQDDLENETLLVCSARQDRWGNTNASNELIAGEELNRKTEREKDEAKSEQEESGLGARSTGKAVRDMGITSVSNRSRHGFLLRTPRRIRVEL